MPTKLGMREAISRHLLVGYGNILIGGSCPLLPEGLPASDLWHQPNDSRLTGESNVRIWELKESIRLCLVAGTLSAGLALAPAATATITVYTNPNVGGWVEDTATPQFLNAVGEQPTAHLTFEYDKYGNPVPGNDGGECICDGDLFSNWVDLRSPDANESEFISPARVLVVGLDPSALTDPNQVRVGGAPQYRGPLEISFFGLGDGATTALGVGNISFGTDSTITLYDENDAQIGVYSGASNEEFTFVGFVATDGELIGRAVLQGTGESNDIFAIQDLSFVPEPGATALAFAALLTLATLRSRTRQ
jgi:hypothetical protein